MKGSAIVRHDVVVLALSLCLASASGGLALAADPHTSSPTGQPSQSCEVTTATPGNAVSAGGAAFNPAGHAGTVYAGQQPQNSVNPNSVSQYDVACFQQTSRVP
jgi:hypothetical protein